MLHTGESSCGWLRSPSTRPQRGRLESDLSAVISENESLLLYRGFRAMDGNVAVALKVLVRSSQMSLQKRLA